MFRSITKLGFQRIVAMLLLVTFAPLAVLSEAGHLIPGLSGSCDCFKVDVNSLHNPKVACSHVHGLISDGLISDGGDAEGVSAKFIEVGVGAWSDISGECVLHAFCSLFNSVGVVVVMPPVSQFIAEIGGIELLSLSSEFCSLFQARAPPLV
jgi:hypothetical protein